MGKVIKTKITEQQAQDAAIAEQYAAQFNALNDKISAEQLTRTRDVQSLAQDLNAEITTRTQENSQFQADLNAEISTRANETSKLATDLISEIQTRSADVAKLNSDLNAESLARNSAELKLQQNIDAETLARNLADSKLTTDLNSEIENRKAAVSKLTTDLNSEIDARKAADSKLSTDLNSEINNRTAAVSTLRSDLISKIDAETSARSSADDNLKSLIDKEISDRTSADEDLKSQIDKEVTDRDKAISDMQAAIMVSLGDLQSLQNIENENLKKSIEEQASSQSGNAATLNSKIEQEISDRNAAIVDVNKNIADEIAAIQNALNALKNSLTSDINSKTNSTLSEAKTYADEKFTGIADSISDFTAPTSSKAGTHGLVPAPAKGTTLMVLTNFGWRQIDDAALTIANAPAQSGTLTYNAKAQSPKWSNYDENKLTIGGTTSGTNAGSYTATFTPKDLYIWGDTKTQAAKSVTWKIAARKLAKPTAATTSFNYSGSEITLDVSNYNSTYITRTGTYSATDSGSYTVTYALKNKTNTTWSDGTTANVSITWTIAQAKLTAAQSSGFRQTGTLTFNTEWQTPTIKNYNPEIHELGGVYESSDAGTFTATIAPKDGRQWSNGATTPKEISWSIALLNIVVPASDGGDSQRYSGELLTSKSFSKSEVDEKYIEVTGTTSAINAGVYKYTCTLKYPSNTKWITSTGATVGGSASRRYSWTIGIKSFSKISVKESLFFYNGEIQTLSLFNAKGRAINFEDYQDYITQSGTTSATNVGNYKVTYSLKDKTNYGWLDESSNISTDDIVIDWQITNGVFTKPVISDGHGASYLPYFDYTGSAITPTLGYFNSTYMKISGTYSATNAVSSDDAYQMTIALKDKTNHTWDDGTTDDVVLRWYIMFCRIWAPKLTQSEFDYTGSAISIMDYLENYDSSLMTISGYSQTNAGTYTATVSLKDKKNYIWRNTGRPDDFTLTWKINGLEIQKPTLSSINKTYDGESQAPIINGFDANTMSQTGTASATNAGTYTLTFKLKNKTNTTWSDGTTDDVALTWNINPLKLTKPSISDNEKTYSGESQSPTISNYLSDYMNQSGSATAVNAATYNLTYTLKSKTNTTWADGSTDNVILSWTIAPLKLAKPRITRDERVTYHGDTKTPTVSNFDATYMTQSGTASAIKTGTYSLTYTLKSKTNTTWADDSTDNITLTWEIMKLAFTKITVNQSEFDYTGSEISVEGALANYAAQKTYLTASGLTQTNAGNYAVTIALNDKENYKWKDGSTADLTLYWSIRPVSVAIPSLAQDEFDYSGSAVSVQINGADDSLMKISGTTSATNAGVYIAKVELKDATNYIWQDRDNAPIGLGWKIKARAIDKPTLINSAFDYSGSAISAQLSNFDADLMSSTGTFTATNTGTYSITIKLKNTTNYYWSDGTTDDFTLTWNITSSTLTKEQSTLTAKSSPTFKLDSNGTPQSFNLVEYVKGYDANYMTASGETTASAAGEHIVKIAPKSGYCWNDGSTAAKDVAVTIAKLQILYYTLSQRVYNGKSQGAQHAFGVEESPYGTATGDTSATNVGTYTVTLKLKYPESTTWPIIYGGGTADKILTWTIAKATLAAPTATSATYFIADGSNKYVTFDGYDSSLMTQSGTDSASAVGDYEVTFTLKDTKNYQFDGGATSVTINWSIGANKIPVPTLSCTAIKWGLCPSGYEGEFDSFKFAPSTSLYWDFAVNGFNSELMTVTEYDKANVGNLATIWDDGARLRYYMVGNDKYVVGNKTVFNCTVALNDTANNTWADGTTAPKKIKISMPYYVIPKAVTEMEPLWLVADGNPKYWQHFFDEFNDSQFKQTWNLICSVFKEYVASSVIESKAVGTAAGTYTLTLTPNYNCKWYDGTTAAKKFTLRILPGSTAENIR